MTEQEAIEQASRALDRWVRANRIVSKSKFVMDADRRDRDRRLMELDDALMKLDRFKSVEASDLSQQINQAMMGASA